MQDDALISETVLGVPSLHEPSAARSPPGKTKCLSREDRLQVVSLYLLFPYLSQLEEQ